MSRIFGIKEKRETYQEYMDRLKKHHWDGKFRELRFKELDLERHERLHCLVDEDELINVRKELYCLEYKR